MKIDYGTLSAGAELAQGGRGINGIFAVLVTFVYAELLASLFQAEADLCAAINTM